MREERMVLFRVQHSITAVQSTCGKRILQSTRTFVFQNQDCVLSTSRL